MRNLRKPTFCLTCVVAAWLSTAPPAATVARAEATPASLRTELETLRAAAKLPPAALETIAYQLDVADRIERSFPPQAVVFRKRAADLIKTAKTGADPTVAQRGKILMRGYTSSISSVRQGYAVYIPKDYDPKRAYPLMLVLHGGSANGNLFLGVVLGNNMNWKLYDQHLWDDFTPRWSPDWIVVAPDGFGQVMWRFMGEQDVLDVIADVERQYHIDQDRVVLCGLSNGGVGAYNMGMRYASRFSAVLAISGAPSWLQYAGGTLDALQTETLTPLSGMSLAENAINTDFRYYHGRVDPGPMRPTYVEAFTKHIKTLGVPFKEHWFDAGHDLLYLVHRHGLIYRDLEKVVRNRHPKEVRVVTGDYRANRQHWVTVTRIERLPRLARVRAVVVTDRLRVETTNTLGFSLELRDAPLGAGARTGIEVDGQVVYDGDRNALGQSVSLVKEDGRWKLGAASQPAGALLKKPGVSGPLTDAYFDSMVHVYGTAIPADTEALRKAAEHGARGWPLWLWRVNQRVVADTEVTDELMRNNHLVLYGTPGANRVLSRIEARLPIRVETDAVVAGTQRFTGKAVGTRFVYPNPLATERYVIVQAAPSIEGVTAGHNLPDFLPDYVVYDAKSTQTRERLVFSPKSPPLLLGYFDARWQLDESQAERATTPRVGRRPTARTPALSEGNDPESAERDVSKSRLRIPAAPALPPRPLHFAASEATAAGKAAREIARRVQSFTNYRGKIPGATWQLDEASLWSIRDDTTCMAELTRLGIRVKAYDGALPTPVPVPVHLTAPVEGVTFVFMHAAPGGVVSCELAARLVDIARVMRKHRVHTVFVLSAYRDHPYPSFHTLGLALDMSRFDGEGGSLQVKTDFVIDHDHETCHTPAPKTKKAQELLGIACDLAATHRFSSVLTPNYNVGHRDHFHVDVRPDDPRLFVR